MSEAQSVRLALKPLPTCQAIMTLVVQLVSSKTKCENKPLHTKREELPLSSCL